VRVTVIPPLIFIYSMMRATPSPAAKHMSAVLLISIECCHTPIEHRHCIEPESPEWLHNVISHGRTPYVEYNAVTFFMTGMPFAVANGGCEVTIRRHTTTTSPPSVPSKRQAMGLLAVEPGTLRVFTLARSSDAPPRQVCRRHAATPKRPPYAYSIPLTPAIIFIPFFTTPRRHAAERRRCHLPPPFSELSHFAHGSSRRHVIDTLLERIQTTPVYVRWLVRYFFAAAHMPHVAVAVLRASCGAGALRAARSAPGVRQCALLVGRCYGARSRLYAHQRRRDMLAALVFAATRLPVLPLSGRPLLRAVISSFFPPFDVDEPLTYNRTLRRHRASAPV